MPGNQVVPRFLPIIVILVLAAFSRAEAQQTTDSQSRMSGADYRSGVEQETFSLVNQYRKTHELSLLAWDDSIAKVARAHSKDMATGEVDFGHEGFSDRVGYLKTVMTGLWGAGENVLMTSELDQVAQRAVALWLRSPHHLENIRGDYNYSGLGVWQDKNGAIYFTQIFVKIRTPAEETEIDPMPSVITPFGMLTTPNTRARP
jgi:uncharacterized protein YkwD